MTHWPRHGRITGPDRDDRFRIDRQRNIAADRAPLRVRPGALRRHRPERFRPEASRRARRPLRARGPDARQLSRRADQIPDRGLGPRFLRQPVGRHLVARPHAPLPRARRALRRYRRRALAGLLLRQVARQRRAHQLRLARDGARRTAQESGRFDRRLMLRRQSRHGVLVRQTGARQSRSRSRRQGFRAEEQRGMGASRPAPRRQGRAYRGARHPARQEPEAAQRVRQHLVDRRLLVGGHAAGRTRLG